MAGLTWSRAAVLSRRENDGRCSSRVKIVRPRLRLRALHLDATLSEVLATALRRRGCDERTARLAAYAGMAVLRLATRRWIFEPDAGFPALLAAGAADLPAVAVAIEGATTASAGERAAAKKS